MTPEPISVSRLIRSRRRTVALQIDRDASLVVRVPERLSEKEILRVLEGRRGWILEQQEKARRRILRTPERRFEEGCTFPFMGIEYPLFFSRDMHADIIFEKAFYIRHDLKSDARRVLESWWRWQAGLLLEERSRYYASAAGVSFSRIRITGAKTRWGSCSYAGTLSYSWRLVLTPPEAADYVAAHEVAHLTVRNHSPIFWKKVASLYPDYLKWKRWLDENGSLTHF